MTRDRSSGSTRRGVLSAVVGIALAGCSGRVGEVLDQRSPTLRGAAISARIPPSGPTVPASIPAPIEGTYLRAAVDRVRALLDPVPTPLSARDIPNGAIREELVTWHDRAIERLRDAEEAPTRLETLQSLRHARADAAAVRDGWRAIANGRTRRDLFDEAEEAESAVEAFRAHREYAGDDPVRAVLVHHRIEHALDSATAAASVDESSFPGEQETPVAVGDLAGDLERARALVADAGYLLDRYTATLDDPVDVGGRLRDAAGSITATIRSRARDLPTFDGDDLARGFDRDIKHTPAAWALRELHDEARDATRRGRGSLDLPATELVGAVKGLAAVAATAAVHDRVTRDAAVAIEAASDVTGYRAAAVEEIAGARDDPGNPGLVDHAVQPAARRVSATDRELRELRDEIRPRWIARDVGDYLVAEELASAAPAAAGVVAATIRDS